jgi:hypothetical protein
MIIKVVIFNSSYPCLDLFCDLLQFSALGICEACLIRIPAAQMAVDAVNRKVLLAQGIQP